MGPETPAPTLTTRRALLQLLFTRESVRWAVTCLVARFPRFLDFFVVLVFSIFSLSSRDLDVSAPSFYSPLVTWCNKECSLLVVRGREIKNARRWSCGAEKIKCCYQLRGSEKHDLFQEEEPLLL